MKFMKELPAVVVLGCCSVLFCSYTWRMVKNWKKREELRKKIVKKQIERRKQFKSLWSSHPITDDGVDITSLELAELLEKLQNGELKSVQVLRAYVAKALRVTEEFNCVTEFIPWAEKLALELDTLPIPKGPLHGLPIAVKDDHDVIGLDSTIGFAKNLFSPATSNSTPVQILLDLGAIPFCKTNVPQALASINSDNPIYGTTLNALNGIGSPGGSSGGSGCIVAGGGALIATGSDIAGSLRIPAHFHGLCALRSTNGRLSSEGMKGGLRQVITMNVVTGFITKDAKSQSIIYKLVTGSSLQSQYDSTVVPLPWNEMLFSSKKPLKIGYYTSLPIYPAFGDTPNVVLKAKAALEKENHHLVEFSLPGSTSLFSSIFGLFWCDLGENLLKEFEHEPVSNSAAGVLAHCKTPIWMRKLLAWTFSLKFLPTYSPSMGELLRMGLEQSTLEKFSQSVHQLAKLRKEILRKMKEEDIDLLLGPAMPFPSVEEKVANLYSVGIIYTFLWNGLDMPAGVVRFGTESGKLIGKRGPEPDNYLDMTLKVLPSTVGLPINVQLIGKPYQEELVLRGLCELESLYNLESKSDRNGNGVKIGNGNRIVSSKPLF